MSNILFEYIEKNREKHEFICSVSQINLKTSSQLTIKFIFDAIVIYTSK